MKTRSCPNWAPTFRKFCILQPARVPERTQKFLHISTIPKSLHWLVVLLFSLVKKILQAELSTLFHLHYAIYSFLSQNESDEDQKQEPNPCVPVITTNETYREGSRNRLTLMFNDACFHTRVDLSYSSKFPCKGKFSYGSKGWIINCFLLYLPLLISMFCCFLFLRPSNLRLSTRFFSQFQSFTHFTFLRVTGDVIQLETNGKVAEWTRSEKEWDYLFITRV